MAANNWWSIPAFRQYFGAIVTGAAARQTTAQIWSTVRQAAADQVTQVLGVTLGRTPTSDEVNNAVQGVLAGMNPIDMNYARQAAGQIVAARQNLLALGPDEQITADAIGTPPWQITGLGTGVRPQYRIRILRNITFHGFTDIEREEWATYDIEGDITTVADAINQANTLFANADYNRSTEINDILDYSVEMV